MFEIIETLIANVRVVLILLFGVATAAGMLFAYMKTRSAPAVIGLAILGIVAIVLVVNMNTFADKVGQDVLGGEQVKVGQVTGTAPPAPAGGGGPTTTVACTKDQSDAGLC